ncbi:MAG: mono/diheme cytochrome c family protein [Pirellulaceae bacterium]|jgi:mono/diheme cytochrome c family protein
MMIQNTFRSILVSLCLFALVSVAVVGRADEPSGAADYVKDVAPIFKKHCASCHNEEDREGDLSVETFAKLQNGGEHGPALLAGEPNSSRLIRLITGQAKPLMPPEENDRLTKPEIETLKSWIAAGAKGPAGAEPDRTKLLTPTIKPNGKSRPSVTALAWSPDGEKLAIARFKHVTIRAGKKELVLTELDGKVNDISFSGDSKRLLTATGIAGLFGRATIWDAETGAKLHEFTGHRDTLYAAALDPSGSLVATASYDRKIILWEIVSGKAIREMTGHNGAIYDLAFSPDGKVLASAAGDETVKLWQVETGLRLDTLGQPLDEQYVVKFSPDGKYIIAGGADNRIRVWRFLSRENPRINPLVYSRFAHDGPIVGLEFARDGKSLISVSDDRTMKQWETKTFTQQVAFERQSDVVATLAVSPIRDQFTVGRMDGSLADYPISKIAGSSDSANQHQPTQTGDVQSGTPKEVAETEPNNVPAEAKLLDLPAIIKGKIAAADGIDEDHFRFAAKRGEQIMVEVNAARSKSKLDSRIEVLDADGNPIERVLLRAVRDSYFTFRGKDSTTSDDFRVHNWEEMELNEYLYANGEVVKLWLYPRGPDSGFKVYPGQGSRYTYLDTTALAHALHSPVYVVEPHPPGTEFIPNGLPVFPIHFENDDDSRRNWGSDSRLTFTAPTDGEFIVRLVDVRGEQGDAYHYSMTVRQRAPDFKVSLVGANPSVNAGSGREFTVSATRTDDFDGEIRVDIENLPPGFHATTPVIIEAGQIEAKGVIYADADAAAPTAENSKTSKIVATATIWGEARTKDVDNLGEIKLAEKAKLTAFILPAVGEPANDGKPVELVIAPGETISARVRVNRDGFKGQVSFGNADAGRNLAHGIYVDNIGLSGLLVLDDASERTFFITAAKWVPESTRLFHLLARVEGNQATIPVIVRVRKPEGQ